MGLGVLVLLASLHGSIALYSHLHTDLRELLPQGAPAAVALTELERRVPGLASLTVVVQAKDPRQGEQFIDALAEQVRKLPLSLVSRVDADLHDETAFAKAHGALYAETADLQTIADGLQRRRAEARNKANPFHIDIDAKPAQPAAAAPAKDDGFDAAVQRLEQKAKSANRFPSGYFASEDGKTLIMNVKPADVTVDLTSAQTLYRAVDSAARGLASRFPAVRVGYSGEVRGMIEAQQHLIDDLKTSTVLVLVSVSLVLLLYFGHLRSLPQLIGPLLIGTTATFAVSRLVIDYLNPNTAFLGSIIIGNGINAGIILLSRYDQERRGGNDAVQAWGEALAGTWLGTLTASGAAALSYGALGTVQFRGFNQFGFMGLVGMLLCWLTTYAWLPALTCLIERWRPPTYNKLSRPFAATRKVSQLLTSHPLPALALALVLTGLAVAGTARFAREPIEQDLKNLGSRQGQIDGEAYWGHSVDAVMRSYQTPTVVLADSPAQAETAARALRQVKARQGPDSSIDAVRTLSDFMPVDQPQRLAALQTILEQLKPAGGALGEVDAKMLKQVRTDLRDTVRDLARQTRLTPVSVEDLPPRWGAPFQEKTGDCIGCIALVYPTLDADAAHSAAQTTYAQLLRDTVGRAVPKARIAGMLVLTSDINRAITVDGRGATLLSLLAVALVTLLVLRSWSASAWVLGSLAIGVLWMFGSLGWLGIKLNFVNFAVMPITFGIGIDYAVNYVQRYRQLGDARQALDSVGGAVTLCSATTILGYATLATADNRGVQSFGTSAVIGEMACLTAALLLTPALLAWRDGREQSRRRRVALAPIPSSDVGVP